MHVLGQISRVLLHQPRNRYGGFPSKQIPPTETQSAFDATFSGWDFFGKIPSEIKTGFWHGAQERIARNRAYLIDTITLLFAV
jgi:hypothetical protein